MDLINLRVFNAIHELGLSEQDFKELQAEQDKDLQGLFIQSVKKGFCICVDHENKHGIIIKKLKGGEARCRVLFKTLIKLLELPREVYNLHEIGKYRSQDETIRFKAETLEELKDRIVERFCDDYPKLASNYDYEKRDLRPEKIEEQVKALYWLFNEDYKSFKKVLRPNIPKIIKVFQGKNRRLALIQNDEERSGGVFETTLKIKTFKPSNPEYNYVSEGRELFFKEYRESSLWVCDELLGKVSYEELKVLAKKLENDTLLTPDLYNESSLKMEMLSQKRESLKKQAVEKLVSKVNKDFENGKAVRKGITFTHDTISYEGLVFKASKVREYVEQQQVLLVQEPDYNNIIKGYVSWVLKPEVNYNYYSGGYTECKFLLKDKESLTFNNTRVDLRKQNKLFYINDKVIREKDLLQAILEARNHSQKSYDEWISYTSKVPLEFQDCLTKGGFSFELKIDKTQDTDIQLVNSQLTIPLTIPVKRLDGKNFATIKGVDYRIKDLNSFLELKKQVDSSRIGRSGGGYIQRSVKLLHRALQDITPKDIGDLIVEGRKEFVKLDRINKNLLAKKTSRSRDFLKNAIKITKAQSVNDGWLVEGLSGMNYYLTKDLRVYKTDGAGKATDYLCIVDNDYFDKSCEWKVNDVLAKRLLMLSKDLKVAKQVYENGDKMDKWWLELMQNETEEEVLA